MLDRSIELNLGATPEIEGGIGDAKLIQGPQGPQGPAGPQGEQGDTGAAGADGADGISCTHAWSGTTLTVTSASGTSSADLKGEKGDKGDKGDTGPAGAGSGDMLASVYDPQGKAQDVFAYADGKVDKSGGAMTGALTLSGSPTEDLHAATKAYVDGYVITISGSFSDYDETDGLFYVSSDKTAEEIYAAYSAGKKVFAKVVIDGFDVTGTALASLLHGNSSGGTISLYFGYVPAEFEDGPMYLAIKIYGSGGLTDSYLKYDKINADMVGAVPKSGGTMTGALTLSGAPTADLHAATKAYVDGKTVMTTTDPGAGTDVSASYSDGTVIHVYE